MKINELYDEQSHSMKRVVVRYATHEFPICKELEQQLNDKAKAVKGNEVDRTMSKDNVRSLTFEIPSNKVSKFKSAANKLISSHGFSKK